MLSPQLGDRAYAAEDVADVDLDAQVKYLDVGALRLRERLVHLLVLGDALAPVAHTHTTLG